MSNYHPTTNTTQHPHLRVARFLPTSYANGPGVRAVLWVQGCTHNCPGCFNPVMHAPEDGKWLPIENILARIIALSDTIEGLSISGGEPLQQRIALTKLLQDVRRTTSLSTLLFTGYTWDEIQPMPHINALLACVDVLIAGRYDATQPQGWGMLGSANQTVHLLTTRYTTDNIVVAPASEMIITEEGEIIVSGVNPVQI